MKNFVVLLFCLILSMPATSALFEIKDGKVICKEGYELNKSGNNCKSFDLPPNAEYIENGWKCSWGFLKIHDLCHSEKSLKENEEWQALTPELRSIVLQLMPEHFVSHLAGRVDRYVKHYSAAKLAEWDYSIEDFFQPMVYRAVQLDTSELPEIFIEQGDVNYCGSGGCSGFVIKFDEDGPRLIGDVFYSGKLVPPIIGPAPAPKSGFYSFAMVSDEGLVVYKYDEAKKKYTWRGLN